MGRAYLGLIAIPPMLGFALCPIAGRTRSTLRIFRTGCSAKRSATRKQSMPRSSRVAKKLKLQERRAIIPSRRSLAACRPLHFFEAINGALCGLADKWGETHGVGTYPGLHYGDGGPGAAAAE